MNVSFAEKERNMRSAKGQKFKFSKMNLVSASLFKMFFVSYLSDANETWIYQCL